VNTLVVLFAGKMAVFTLVG